MNFVVRSSTGIDVWEISNKDDPVPSKRVFKPFFKETRSAARCLAYSEKYFACGTKDNVKMYNLNYELQYTIPLTRSHILKFSPKGTYLIVYEIFISTKENPNSPNLFIYDADTGKELISFVMKKHSEWEPFISNDETLLAIMMSGDVHFYNIANGTFTKTTQKLSGKVGSFSLSPGQNTHVALYLQGVKGSPSMAKLFKYPNLDASATVASKSFSQADKVEMIWNKKGNGCLIITSTDVDTTGVSYYGKQALHFLATNSDSFSVPLKGDGPIHNVAWSPKSNQFIVVYGYEPANASLFNMKCDIVFDFGTGIRNCIYWNDFGNLVLFGAFGNLRGNIEVWDLSKKQQVSTSLATDTTLLEWAPSGDVYFTATTCPRLRQGNNFKIWHYSGALLFELIWPDKQELYELAWQKYAENFFKEPVISSNKIEGIQSSQPQASTKKYVPPNIREFGETGESSSSSVAPPAQGPIPGLPPGYTSSSKFTQPKKFSQRQSGNKHQNADGKSQHQQQQRQKQRAKPSNNDNKNKNNNVQVDKPQMSEEDKKKVTAIRKKLKDIKGLKEKQEKGEKLDNNQVKKIAMEDDLNKELKALTLS
ncbi:hypothetical protein PVAND_005280 [Polypedilum vanderplanki]|uniref:Eukaryotic translation initiation factor 2A n=1 Tax=Polypedilum vanderplanki TaxID=319348 RepID=A0A9J6C0M7_POLVA|nr:hypothetical protein PVAND_005280 [Polypedilum vanderplanki]